MVFRTESGYDLAVNIVGFYLIDSVKELKSEFVKNYLSSMVTTPKFITLLCY